jgi:hypothetical protein
LTLYKDGLNSEIQILQRSLPHLKIPDKKRISLNDLLLVSTFVTER